MYFIVGKLMSHWSRYKKKLFYSIEVFLGVINILSFFLYFLNYVTLIILFNGATILAKYSGI